MEDVSEYSGDRDRESRRLRVGAGVRVGGCVGVGGGVMVRVSDPVLSDDDTDGDAEDDGETVGWSDRETVVFGVRDNDGVFVGARV